MKKYALIFVHIAFLTVLLAGACSHPVKNKLQGTWRSRDGSSKLKITDKGFSIDDTEVEDYFIRRDTIFTSFQGNLPYTCFVVQKLDDHYLRLLGPDSVAMEFRR
jgi:hypothetical protein